MAKPPQPSVNMRKMPIQARSKVTIDAIIDATAQLLRTGSATAITSNHIAERAGVSIGTLYQYFPNKMSVFMAYAERERLAREKETALQLAELKPGTIEDVARQLIHALIASVSRSHSDRQLAILVMLHRLEDPEDDRPIDRIATLIASKLGAFLNMEKSKSEIASFVLTRAITGPIRAAALDAPHMLKEQEFEDQLVRMATGFLRAQ